ncbi:hypothetical protein [Arcobacter roscoffensis]|uniref:Uncharacterized protein n=1 Tax=Arcobacter roscoffensis TaxID=2961520 RepID=A0ABY5E2H2_9BACT|nr:hypothetical protein [Arcobacter roscoffensis]UTJ05238.1 hypothetical protein NJU99_08125 [Arcobacter roscoffensis]
MNTVLKFIKNSLLEILDKKVIFSSLILFFTILMLNVFDTNIQTFDCTINETYYDNSYICVVDYHLNNISGILSVLDPKDTTEIDEIFLILLFYIIGEIIIVLNKSLTFAFNERIVTKGIFEISPYLLSILIGACISFPFLVTNFIATIVILVILFIYFINMIFVISGSKDKYVKLIVLHYENQIKELEKKNRKEELEKELEELKENENQDK